MRVEKGIFLDGKKTAPAKVQILRVSKKVTDLRVTIHEGQKRQIRRMFAKVKHKVVYLQRLKQGPLDLGNLKLGRWRLLKKQEVAALKG